MTRAADWVARVGDVWADEWRRTERAFAGIAATLNAAIDRAAPSHGYAADVGCGAGSTALSLSVVRPGLRITGLDLSSSLIDVARRRAVAGRCDFQIGDAVAALPLLAPLDLLVSRHGVMFFADPVAAFGAMRDAVRVDAPLIFSCFRARAENDWATTIDQAIDAQPSMPAPLPALPAYAPGPFALADPAFITALLDRAGWRDVTLAAHDVDYVIGAGDDPVGDALSFCRRIGPAAAPLAAADPAVRADLENRLAAMLAPRIRDGAVTFTAAIWIVSARAGKEAS
ncbi:class I SAM-dependent methyltransferase [Sphingomonas endophytica]|uniref:Methyltransferase type 11 domain-containing protein n=1 Tax=Sphingomonas endophytica TaxID=869719 RepID=A0A147I9Q8_9SPHN|nr:class I SAM-dependent methyltransferase [Sphingomonas endophytica]KTT76240.1 hypothetical protein NS334_01320 [Sphingomonas endophytica]